MKLDDTNFGKIVVELNNFTDLISPNAIAKFEGMSEKQILELAKEKSFRGEVAKWYNFLIKSMRVISTPEEAVNPDVDLPEEEAFREIADDFNA